MTAFLILLLIAWPDCPPKEPPPNVQKWLDKLESAKLQRAAALKEQIASEKSSFQGAETPKERSKAKKRLADLNAKLKAVNSGEIEPNVIQLSLAPEIGDIGGYPGGEIVSISNDGSVIVEVRIGPMVTTDITRTIVKKVEGRARTYRYAITGVETDGLVPGREGQFKEVFEVTAVKEIGGTRIPVLKPFDPSHWIESAKKTRPQDEGRQTESNPEEIAASKLRLAKSLLNKGKKADAIKRLKAIAEEFPDTEAGKEAAELLEGAE